MTEAVATAQKREYWRWREYDWRDESLDWKRAGGISVGIDVGSVSSQAVVMCDGKLFAYSSLRTGSNSKTSAQRALEVALQETGMPREKVNYLVATGYGRVNIPFAQKAITEIACHARGANFIYGPTVKTVLDMGGQDCKAIRCDGRGKVTNFLMNDKCAAGTGRGMEVMAELLQIPIEDVGPASLSLPEEPPPVSSTCVVFAKSEALGLLRQNWSKEKVLGSFCLAMAHRTVELLSRVGVEKDFAITGGISKNIGIVKRIETKLGVEALKPSIDPQIAGALGAALFAKALYEKELSGNAKTGS
ncbi:MAG: benzoyl-CoA reductase, bzd-type, subunit Q [Candidatus Fraserbacteria bacterium RBG_16_55_9]|uniref:Benzoyl-CoA reductase, bzd-type, subunit Q n=1 Tax=Fraserbacteria sp. (strain RBG_16_55_9) TaxID=1817864 RepID=A0A1F5UV87_FRAXR|nr:MAG: benzoyl-CoA reductase, bzd-type, subunit Q [Candidatus Fraserbacteria bacterium RBG_16_55_9]